MMMKDKINGGYFALISILIVTAIISFLFVKLYVSTPKTKNNDIINELQPKNDEGEKSTTTQNMLRDDVKAAHKAMDIVNEYNIEIQNESETN